LALIAACVAIVAAALPSPGLYVAMGAGIAAIGAGWLGLGQREAPGLRRLAGAAAITVGSIGFVLGALRVILALAALSRIDAMLGG
jgi:hypothetical protein